MAFNLLSIGTGLGGLIAGYDQAKNQAQQQQLRQIQMQALQAQQQQQKAQQNQQQQLQGVLGNVFGGLAGGDLPQPSGGVQPVGPTPMPGQASVPMADPGSGQPPAPPQQPLINSSILTPPSPPQAPPAYNNPASTQFNQTAPNAGNAQLQKLLQQPQPAAQAPAAGAAPASGGSIADYIRQGAIARGLDPNEALRTANSEGGTDGVFRLGDGGKSGGPFQLYTGGGLGNDFQKAGHGSPLDPKNEKATIDYALDYAAAHGGKFDPNIWHGLRNGGGGSSLAAAAPPQAQQAAKTTANQALWQLPPAMYGRTDYQTLAKMVEKTNPDAPPYIKFLALEQLQKVMAPDSKAELQMMMMQQKEQLQLALKDMTIENQRGMLAQRQQGSDQQLNQREQFQAGQQVQRQDFQRSREAEKAQSPISDSDVDFWANVVRNGGHLPPGLSRTAAGSQVVQRIMAKVPGMAGSDAGNLIANTATVKADDRSLGNMTKMADAATSFEQTASRNFDLALNLSKDAVPTDWGPFLNRWIESGETQFGDTNVPPYVTAMLTGANEYAKIMSGSTGAQGSTVDSRREAAELFSPYLSKGQIDRVVAVAKQDMTNRKQSLYGQIDDIKGRLRSAGSSGPTATQGQSAPAAGGAPAPGTVQDGFPLQGRRSV